MKKIEQGGATPLLGGEIGHYLLAYARERNAALSLALDSDLQIRRDQGAITVDAPVRLIAAPTQDAFRTFATGWGDVSLALAFCPELYAVATLRLWHSAYAAREAVRELKRWSWGTIDVVGAFRWLPPNVLTAGEARYVGRPSRPGESWRDLAFLAATADDLYAPPHALEYVVGRVGATYAIAHIRSFVVKVKPGGEEFVPGGTFADPVVLRREDEGSPLAPGLWLALAYRTPDTRAWRLWVTEKIDADQALRHLVGWGAFRALLREDAIDPEQVDGRARRALDQLGIRPTSGQSSSFPELALPTSAPLKFARSLVAQMRLA
jgi:hypothetical protein